MVQPPGSSPSFSRPSPCCTHTHSLPFSTRQHGQRDDPQREQGTVAVGGVPRVVPVLDRGDAHWRDTHGLGAGVCRRLGRGGGVASAWPNGRDRGGAARCRERQCDHCRGEQTGIAVARGSPRLPGRRQSDRRGDGRGRGRRAGHGLVAGRRVGGPDHGQRERGHDDARVRAPGRDAAAGGRPWRGRARQRRLGTQGDAVPRQGRQAGGAAQGRRARSAHGHGQGRRHAQGLVAWRWAVLCRQLGRRGAQAYADRPCVPFYSQLSHPHPPLQPNEH